MENMNTNFQSTNPNDGSQHSDFVDIMNMPVDKAVAELVRYGASAIKSIKDTANSIFQSVADEQYKSMCRPIVTMDDCLKWLNVQRQSYSQAAYFFIYTEKTPAPRNENDIFTVTIAVIDAYKKTIPVHALKPRGPFSSAPKNQDIVCMVIPARTLDTKLLKALNGGSSVLIKL